MIANVGKLFCKSYCILEGDSNLVFCTNVILPNVELFVGDSVDEFTLPFDHKLDNNIEKAVHILSKYQECFVVAITEAKKLLEEKAKRLTKVQLLIEVVKLQKKILEDRENINNNNIPSTNNNILSNMGQRRSGRSNVNLDYRSMSGIRSRNNNTNDNNNNNNNNNTNPLDHIQQQLNSIKSEWVDLKALRDDAQKQVTAKERDLINYTTGRITEETEFRSFALDIAKPAINYFLKQMNTDYLKILRDGLRAVQCFDPLFINNNDQVTLQVLVRDLVHLGLYNIDTECINGMISELQKLKDEAKDCKNEFDLLEGAEEYNNKLHNKNKKNGSTEVWQDDNAEYAHRIWKWWKSRKHKFVYFIKAIKLVALIQTSSASVERVFSQVKIIIDTVGSVAIKDNIEYRVMSRVNKHLMK